jgi:hypothetical protein
MAHHLSGKLVNCHEIVKFLIAKISEVVFFDSETGGND